MTLHRRDGQQAGWPERALEPGAGSTEASGLPSGMWGAHAPERPTPGVLGRHLALGWQWPPLMCDSCTLCHRLSPPLAGRDPEPTSQPWTSPQDETGAASLGSTSRASEAAPSPTATVMLWEQGHAARGPGGRVRATGATAGHRAPGGRTGWQDPSPQVLVQDGHRPHSAPGAGTAGRVSHRPAGPQPQPGSGYPLAPSLLPGTPPLTPSSEPLNHTL